MSDLNIRNIPDEVRWSIKIEAAAADMTLKDWVIAVLAGACTSRVIRPASTDQPIAPRRNRTLT